MFVPVIVLYIAGFIAEYYMTKGGYFPIGEIYNLLYIFLLSFSLVFAVSWKFSNKTFLLALAIHFLVFYVLERTGVLETIVNLFTYHDPLVFLNNEVVSTAVTASAVSSLGSEYMIPVMMALYFLRLTFSKNVPMEAFLVGVLWVALPVVLVVAHFATIDNGAMKLVKVNDTVRLEHLKESITDTAFFEGCKKLHMQCYTFNNEDEVLDKNIELRVDNLELKVNALRMLEYYDAAWYSHTFLTAEKTAYNEMVYLYKNTYLQESSPIKLAIEIEMTGKIFDLMYVSFFSYVTIFMLVWMFGVFYLSHFHTSLHRKRKSNAHTKL